MLWLVAACLVVLILLPLGWLAVYAFTDKARNPTLQNFITLFSDPDFPRSAADDGDHRHHVGHAVLHRRRTDQLAGVAHRPAGPAVHPRAGDGVLRDAAVPRRGGVGVAGGAEQRACSTSSTAISPAPNRTSICSTSIR